MQIAVAARAGLTTVAVAGLAVDAYVHFDLASTYAAVRTSTLSQGELFRVEAVLALLSAAAILVRPRWYTIALALLTAAGGLAALLLYRYVDVGAIGPIPSMYEPLWYPEKTLSAYAEGIAALAAAGLFASGPRRSAGQIR